MLQYVISESSRWTVGELAQMAVEAGCRWISISLPNLSDAEIRNLIVPDVIELCREGGVFLTIDDRPELARELGLHGVRLSRAFQLVTENTPLFYREELGPEAIIGVEEPISLEVPSLLPADIDFVSIPADFDSEARNRYVRTIKSLNIPMPLVAEGVESVEEAKQALADGCSGFAVSRFISESSDPIAAIKTLLALSPA